MHGNTPRLAILYIVIAETDRNSDSCCAVSAPLDAEIRSARVSPVGACFRLPNACERRPVGRRLDSEVAKASELRRSKWLTNDYLHLFPPLVTVIFQKMLELLAVFLAIKKLIQALRLLFLWRGQTAKPEHGKNLDEIAPKRV